MMIDEIIEKVNEKASGRTRYEGQEPFWDEELVAEIGRLRGLIRWYAAALSSNERKLRDYAMQLGIDPDDPIRKSYQEWERSQAELTNCNPDGIM